jgi:hypothetical protein
MFSDDITIPFGSALRVGSAEQLRRLIRRGGFALPMMLPWYILGRADPPLAENRIPSGEQFFSRAQRSFGRNDPTNIAVLNPLQALLWQTIFCPNYGP